MSKYVVGFARYYKYVVDAEDKSDAENKAYPLFQQEVGGDALFDDEMIYCIDSSYTNGEAME